MQKSARRVDHPSYSFRQYTNNQQVDAEAVMQPLVNGSQQLVRWKKESHCSHPGSSGTLVDAPQQSACDHE